MPKIDFKNNIAFKLFKFLFIYLLALFSKDEKIRKLECLDGFRGTLALYVFIRHGTYYYKISSDFKFFWSLGIIIKMNLNWILLTIKVSILLSEYVPY